MDLTNPVQVLAGTLWGEARGIGPGGMRDVAAVIMNRVNHQTWWGKDIISVCQTPYQFSCWNENDPNKAVIEAVSETDPVFMQARSIAMATMAGIVDDITHGATYYYAKSMPAPPKWAVGKTPCAEIAGQLFFNNVT